MVTVTSPRFGLGNYRGRLSNRRGPAWWRQAARAVRPFLSVEQNGLLTSEIKFQAGFAKARLPRGAIHGDLFCDNVLFEGERVSGIIDFGFAATDALVYDLAIAVNDLGTTSRYYARVLGRPGVPVHRPELEATGVSFTVGPNEIQLLASKSEHGPLARWIHERGQSPYEAVLAGASGDPTMLDPELLQGARLRFA